MLCVFFFAQHVSNKSRRGRSLRVLLRRARRRETFNKHHCRMFDDSRTHRPWKAAATHQNALFTNSIAGTRLLHETLHGIVVIAPDYGSGSRKFDSFCSVCVFVCFFFAQAVTCPKKWPSRVQMAVTRPKKWRVQMTTLLRSQGVSRAFEHVLARQALQMESLCACARAFFGCCR